MERPDLKQALGRLLGPAGPEVGCDECFDAARPLRRARARRPRTPTRRSPACARTSTAARPAARSTRACARSSAASRRSSRDLMRNRRALPDGTSFDIRSLDSPAWIWTPSRFASSAACSRSSARRPTQYPLSLNALRLACNQSTNRDPVVDYDERDDPRRRSSELSAPRLDAARERQRQPRGEVPPSLRRGDRARRDAARSARRAHAPRPADARRAQAAHRADAFLRRRSTTSHETLDGLAERELAMRKPRRPGERDDRYLHLLGRREEAAPAEPEPAAESLEQRVARLEDLVADLQRRLPRRVDRRACYDGFSP